MMGTEKTKKRKRVFQIILLMGMICVGCGKAISTDGKTNADIKKEYESALACMEEGNYEEALSIFESIPTTYKDYEEVVEQKKQAEAVYIEELLNTVELKILGKQYADAIAILDSKQEFVAENTELVKKRVEIVELCKENYFTEAEKYASIEDYNNALEQLQQLVDMLGTDADTEIKIMNYKVAQIIMSVKEFEKKEDYATAIEYIQEQLPGVNNNIELAKKLEELMVLNEIKENQPVTSDGKTNADLRKEYEEAVAYMEKGEYESAIKRFDTISRNYKDYDKVIEKRANAVEEYVANAITRADELAANGNYEEALFLLDARCDFLGEESKLDAKIEELIQLCKEAYKKRAQEYAASNDYVNAGNMIWRLIELFGEEDELVDLAIQYNISDILQTVKSYEETKNFAEAIKYLNGKIPSNYDSRLSSLVDKQEELKNLYKQSCLAEVAQYMEQEKYDTAISILEKSLDVLGTDRELEEKVQECTIKNEIQIAEKYVEEGDYTSAIEQLNTAIEKNGNASLLIAKLDEVISDYKENIIEVQLAKYDKDKNYVAAIGYLKEVRKTLKKDTDVATLLEQYQAQYREIVLTEAEQAYQKNGYIEAIEVLGSALDVIGTDKIILEKLEYYYEKKPVMLKELEPYMKGKYYMQYTNSVQDVAGNRYQGGFGTVVSNASANVVYYLNMQYKAIKGKFVIIDANKVTKWNSELKIIDADTEQVLYSAKLNEKDVNGISINVDISQVRFLKLEFTGCEDDCALLVDAWLYKK